MTEVNYHNIIDSISDGIYQINANGYFTLVNKSLVDRYGIPPEKFYSLYFLDIVEPQYRDLVRINFQRVMNGEDNIIQELAHIDSSGQVRHVEIHARPVFEDEKVVALLGISRDITARKQAEKALQESELRFRLAAESSTDLIWEWDIITDEIKWFGPIDKLLGYRTGEFPRTAYAWEAIIHPEDHDRVMAKLERHLGDGTPYSEEYRVLRKDGVVLHWTDRGTALRYTDLKPPKMVGTVTDITDLKLAEEKQKASEMQFRDLIETMPVGIMTYAGTKFRYANPAFEKITGYTRDELNLMDVWDIVHPEFKDNVREYVHRQLNGESVPKLYVVKILTKGGEERWVERGAIPLQLNEKPSMLITVTDITEIKSAEETVKKSEEKYRALLENASDAIGLADEQGNILEVNRKAEELLGYAREELLQMNCMELHPVTELERTMDAFKKIVENGHGMLRDGLIRRKDGNIVPVDITASVIQHDGTRVLQGLYRDITEHKHIEDTLENLVSERTTELSEKNELLMAEMKERERIEASLRKRRDELKLRAGELKELNSALKVLLKQRDEDKRDIEDKVMANVRQLILPYVEELKKGRLDARSKMQVSILEANLNNIISSFTHRLSSKYSGFTPREIQVANLIRQGKSTKDMAEYLRVSQSAINLYRTKIRKKLGIISKKINLRSHLMSLS